MPNTQELFGLPKILIDFKTQATTAIRRSARGIGVLILNDANVTTDTWTLYTVADSTDIPTGLTERNADLIQKALLGTPLKLLVYIIPPATKTVGEGDDAQEVASTITQATILKEVADAKWNYIAHPTGGSADQASLASWVKSQRTNRHKTFKAVVANSAADSYGVINFTTGGINVVNPAWQDAYDAANGDETQIPASIAHYLTYTATEYTARIVGILCGIALDRSATFYELEEVVKCNAYEDIDTNINNGELCLYDDHDGNGVKIARACNSLHTFTTNVGEDFRYIKIVEAIDLIHDDIGETFKSEYVGKVINSYNNKQLFIAAIHVYFNELKAVGVLDPTPSVDNYVEIDLDAHRDWAALRGIDVSEYEDQALREINTGTNVFLSGRITPINAMEDLTLHFVIS